MDRQMKDGYTEAPRRLISLQRKNGLFLGGNELLVLRVAHADPKALSEDMKQRKAKVDIAERKLWLNIRNNSENWNGLSG